MSRMYEALRSAQRQGLAIDIPDRATPEAITPLESNSESVCELPAESKPLIRPTESSLLGKHSASERTDAQSDYAAADIRTLAVKIDMRAALIAWESSAGPGAAQFRMVRTRIVQHPGRPRVLIVSSACPGDGKTATAINVAGVLSMREGTNVLLIDGDSRRSAVSSMLGLPGSPGLADALSRRCSLHDAILRVKNYPNLYVLTAGSKDLNLTELLDSEQWKLLCSRVRDSFSYVIIDAPPVAAIADYDLIKAQCDRVVLVTRPDHTDRTLLKKVFDAIQDEKLLGVVLNDASDWFLWRTHEYYY